MIKDPDIHLEWIHDNLEEMAEAKAKLELLDSQTKSVKAHLMKHSGLASNAAQETWALCHEDYEKHLVKVAEATRTYEALKLTRDYHMACYEAWRTASSNERAVARIR